MKVRFPLIFLILYSLAGFGADNNESLIKGGNVISKYTADSIIIKGQFLDSLNNHPLPYFPMTLHNGSRTDGKLIKSFLLDKYGRFEFSIPHAVDTLVFAFDQVGYNVQPILFGEQQTNYKDLGRIFVSKLLSLEEVKVVSGGFPEEPFKKTYKVRNLETNEIPKVSSFLKGLPEIEFDENGKLSGSNNKPVVYYLNGSKTRDDLILKLPLDIIDKVEIITNPLILNSNEQNAVIINVVTKSPTDGIFGSTNSISGAVLNKVLGVSLEPYYLKGNFLLAVSGNTYLSESQSTSSSSWLPRLVEERWDTNGDNSAKTIPAFLTLFMQKELSKKVKMSTSLDYSQNRTWVQKDLSTFKYENTILQRDIFEEIDTYKSDRSYNGTFELVYKGDKSSIYLNAGLNFYSLDDSFENNIRSSISGFVKTTQSSFSTNSGVQLTYERQLSKIFSGRIGLVYNIRDVKSDLLYQDLRDNTGYKNLTRNKEETQSISTSLDLNTKWGSATIGTKVDKSTNYSDGILFYNKWIFVPFIFVNKFHQKYGNFNLSAYGSVAVPNAVQINSAFIPSNASNVTYGNSKVFREVSNNVDLTHFVTLSSKKRISLNSSMYYRRVTDLIASNGYNYDLPNQRFFHSQANIGDFTHVGLNFNVTKTLAKVGYYRFLGGVGMKNYNLKDSVTQNQILYNIGSSFTLNLLKKVTPSFQVYYREYDLTQYVKTRMRPNMSLSVTGGLIKNKLYFDVTWDDLFNLKSRSTSEYNSYWISRQDNNNYKGQNVSFSLTYTFGKVLEKEKQPTRVVDSPQVKGDFRQ